MKETGIDDTAILIYEQAINLNRSQTATLNSIYDLTILRILERDIYLAYYTLDRLEEIPEDLVDLNLLKLFINGAINMLKKKFQDGIDTLAKIDLEKLKEERLVRLVHSYGAFGLFSLGKITEALNIYKMLEEKNWIVEGDIYNKLICKGIIAGEQNKFDVAEGHFKMARTMLRLRVEPTLYLCVGSF
jgi:tetratricopeptide (TPR) repeat protein